MPSSPVGVPNVSVDPPRKLPTLATKKDDTSIPGGQVLTFPRAIFPNNASNNATTEDAGAWQFGLACAVLAACSVAIPSLAVGAWKRGRVGSALLGGLASACLLGFSIYGTATVELMQRAAQSSERSEEEQRLGDLRAELKAAQDRIADLGVHRSAAQIDAEMKAEQQSARWTATEGCTRVTTAESRAYCATHARLFGELAGAGESDRHLASIERIRQQIKDVLASRRSSMADFEVALIARILKADKDAVEPIRAVGRAVAIDLFGVASLTLVWANHPETHALGSTQLVRATTYSFLLHARPSARRSPVRNAPLHWSPESR
jgi:hypothetical protein